MPQNLKHCNITTMHSLPANQSGPFFTALAVSKLMEWWQHYNFRAIDSYAPVYFFMLLTTYNLCIKLCQHNKPGPSDGSGIATSK